MIPTLFPTPPKPKRPRRKLAHMIDTGEPGAVFECRVCGWNSDWRESTAREIWRGIPCERCNP